MKALLIFKMITVGLLLGCLTDSEFKGQQRVVSSFISAAAANDIEGLSALLDPKSATLQYSEQEKQWLIHIHGSKQDSYCHEHGFPVSCFSDANISMFRRWAGRQIAEAARVEVGWRVSVYQGGTYYLRPNSDSYLIYDFGPIR